jgi:hypothetical protein
VIASIDPITEEMENTATEISVQPEIDSTFLKPTSILL